MSGYIGTQSVALSTVGGDIGGDVEVSGTIVVNGNIGIRTTTPNYPLDINTSVVAGGVAVRIRNSDSTSLATFAQLRLETGLNTAAISAVSGTGGAGYLQFDNEGAERIRIDSDGNLLIGHTVTNPIVSGITGFKYFASGTLQLSKGSGHTIELNRYGTDGSMVDLYKNGSLFANIGTASGGLTFGTGLSGTERVRIGAGGGLSVSTTIVRAPITSGGAISSYNPVVNGNSIATAIPRIVYHVMICSNFNTGDNVRSAAYYLTTNNEGTGITNVTTAYVFNAQTATFSVSAGQIIISGMSAGNNTVAVFHG
jgi:hypothetical protein